MHKHGHIIYILTFMWFVGTIHASDKLRPNVIYIYASDMGKGLISAYGQKQFTTPNIDHLVQHGISFDNAYGGASAAHARAALMTGYHDCHQNKWNISKDGQYALLRDTAQIESREHLLNGLNIPLQPEDMYLPQVFNTAGYVTAQIGKLGWGKTTTRQQMQAYGWDYYYGFLDFEHALGYYPPYLFDNGQIVLIEGNTRKDCGTSPEEETEETFAERHDMTGKQTYSEDLFLEKSLQFIREHRDDRFFLMYCTQLPAGPVSIPEIDSEIADNRNLTPVEKEYASMVRRLDQSIGAIFNELKELQLEKQTMIIFASNGGHQIYYSQKGRIEKPYRNMITGNPFDHSFEKYYSDKAGDVFNGNAGMAGIHGSNLEGGIHIPLVFYWEGTFKSNTVKDIVSNYDFLPTMADMLGIRLKEKKDGISFLQTLTKRRKLPQKRHIVVASPIGPAIIVNDGWKLRYDETRNLYQLYNLKNDPQEKYDIILRQPQQAEELKKILIEACDGNVKNGIRDE